VSSIILLLGRRVGFGVGRDVGFVVGLCWGVQGEDKKVN